MTCIVTIKGKKFYKDDFIHMVLDTMKITPEEIATNEYLKKIKYSSDFGIGDPLGIRKKTEEKDPVKDVVTLADKFNALSKGKKKQSSENTTNLRNKITQQAKDQGLDVEFRRGNGKEKVVLTKDGKKINNIKAGNEFFTASEFDAGDVVYDKSKNTLKYRVLENGDLKDIKTGKVITPEENQLFGLSKSAYMDEYSAAKKAVLGKEAETVEEAIMQAFASGARIRWRSKMKAGKDGLGDLLGDHMSKEATGFRLGKDKVYDSVDDFLTGIKEGIEWDDGKARTAIAELIQKYDSPAKMLEALIDLRGEKKVTNKEGEWDVQKSPDEIAFEEQFETIKNRHKMEAEELNAIIRKFGDIDEVEIHLNKLKEVDGTPEIQELVDNVLSDYITEKGDINIAKLSDDINSGKIKLDNEIINNLKETINESNGTKETESTTTNRDDSKAPENPQYDTNKEKGGTQAGVKSGSSVFDLKEIGKKINQDELVRFQQLSNSLREGELLLKDNVDASGNKLTPEKRIQIEKSIESTKQKIESLPTKEGKGNVGTPKEQPDTTPTEKPLNEPVNKVKTPIELAKEKLAAAKERANKLRDQSNLGTIIDPFKKVKDQAIADREVLDQYVNLAVEYIKTGVKTAEEFAKEIGEKVEDIKKAWDIAEKGEVYGIKVAMLDDAVRDALHDKGDRRLFEEVEIESRRKVANGQIDPEAIVNKVNSGEKYLPNGEDIIALVDYKVVLENRRKEINDLINKENNQGKKEAYTKELLANYDKLFAWDEMAIRTAADQSQAFRFRKLMRDNEFNAVREIMNWKARDKNGEIPSEVVEKIKEYEKKIVDLNEKLTNAEQKVIEVQEQAAINNIKAEAKRANAKAPARKSVLSTEKLARLQELDKVLLNKLNNFDEALKFLFTKDGREWLSLVFEEAVGDFKVFSKDLVKKLGKEVAPHLKDLFKSAGGTDKAIYDGFRPEMKKNKLVIPHNLIRSLVEAGIDDIVGITNAVHEMVKNDLPGITKMHVRNAITEYGKKRNPSKDVIEGKIRTAKRIGRSISNIERLKKGYNALRSGLQRDKPSPRERQLLKEINKLQKLLPKSAEEIKKGWATALDKAKTHLKNQIEELDQAIKDNTPMVVGDKTPLPLDKKYFELKDRRDALKKEYDEKFGKDIHEITDAERIERSIAALEREAEKIVKDIKEGNIEYKKNKILPVSLKLNKARDRYRLITEVLNDLRKEEGIAAKKELEIRKDANVRAIMKMNDAVKSGEYSPREKKVKTPEDEELTKILIQKNKTLFEFEKLKEKHRLSQRTPREVVWETILDVTGGFKALKTGLDFSAGGRQGLSLSIANPKMGARAFKMQFEHAFDESASKKWLAELHQKPIYRTMRDAGLYISEPSSKLSAKEEVFSTQLVQRIPYYGKLMKGSERAYVGYLNSLRTDLFEKLATILDDQGKTFESDPQAYKDIADFINVNSGRGKFPVNDAAISSVLSPLLFAPKYVASRFNILNPLRYANVLGKYGKQRDALAREQQIKTTITFAAATFSVLGLLKLSGMADVETDPTSSDFLKIKIGNKRIDITAGYAQELILLARTIFDSYKTNKGEVVEYRTPGGSNEYGVGSAFLRFGRGKLAPIPSMIPNMYFGEDITGEDVTLKSTTSGLVSPLFLTDLYNLYKKEGASVAAPLAIPLLFGFPVSSYGTKDLMSQEVVSDKDGVSLNFLGEPSNNKAFISNADKEMNDVWRFLEKYNFSQSKPKKSDLTKKDSKGNDIPITDNDFIKYVKLSGRYIKEELRDLKASDNGVESMPKAEQSEAIKAAIKKGKDKAKDELFNNNK